VPSQTSSLRAAEIFAGRTGFRPLDIQISPTLYEGESNGQVAAAPACLADLVSLPAKVWWAGLSI